MRRRTFLKAIAAVTLGACAPVPTFIHQKSPEVGQMCKPFTSAMMEDVAIQLQRHRLQVDKFLINRAEIEDIKISGNLT